MERAGPQAEWVVGQKAGGQGAGPEEARSEVQRQACTTLSRERGFEASRQFVIQSTYGQAASLFLRWLSPPS